MQNSKLKIKKIIKQALEEDIGSGDVTTDAVIPRRSCVKARIIAKERGIVAGLDIMRQTFEMVDRRIKFKSKIKDGGWTWRGRTLAEVSGPASSILTAERTALNFLERMSGIATLTSKFVKKVKRSKVKIMDTRKTAPGLRVLDKYAVKVGGGVNHRFGLYDAVLIKENHIAITGSLKKAVSLARRKAKGTMEIEVEARNLAEVKEAIDAGVNTILLDNMNIRTLKKSVLLVKEANKKIGVPQAYIRTEASGRVNLDNVREIAKTGVDAISIGSLTHSAPALDISLEI